MVSVPLSKIAAGHSPLSRHDLKFRDTTISLGNYSPPARTQHREHAQHSRGAFLPRSIQQPRAGRRRRARSPCTLLQPAPGAGAAFLGSAVPAALPSSPAPRGARRCRGSARNGKPRVARERDQKYRNNKIKLFEF